MKFTVALNGTDQNPYHQFGLKQNPFPQIGDARYDPSLRHLARLGAEPIPDIEYIKKHLTGWSDEFVNLCCRMFKKGEMVRFTVKIAC